MIIVLISSQITDDAIKNYVTRNKQLHVHVINILRIVTVRYSRHVIIEWLDICQE